MSGGIRGPVVVGASGGGGFQIGTSYLHANYTEQDAVPSALAIMEWTEIDSAGSDVEIDGDDSTLINILTTGWYQLSFYAEWAADGGDNLKSWYSAIGLNGADMQAEGEDHTSASADNFIQNRITSPARLFTAGDILFFYVNAIPVLGGTFSVSTPPAGLHPDLTIVRLS